MRRIPDLPPPEFIAKDRWYTLVPKRSLGKIVAMLIVLAGVIYFRSRAGSVVGLFGKTVTPAGIGTRPRAPAPLSHPAAPHADGGATHSVPSSAP